MTKISDEQIVTSLEQGLSQAEIARQHGISEGALSRRVKKLGILKARGGALFAAGRMLKSEMDAADMIQRSARQLTDVLDDVQAKLYGDPRSLEYGEASARLRRLVPAKSGSLLTALVPVLAELRKQLALAADIRDKACSWDQVEKFQQTVLEEIRAADPAVAQEITKRLVKLGALHSSLDVSRPQALRTNER